MRAASRVPRAMHSIVPSGCRCTCSTGLPEERISEATTSVDSGYPLFNQHLQAEDYFSTAQFPTATYKSTKVNFDGDKVASVEGNLTLKGVTKPVTLTIVSSHCMPHPMLKKDACGATATAKVKRSDFNMGMYAPLVGDEVTITLPVEAVKQ